LVETEGVVVYEEPLQRPARPRRRPDDVRMALVRAWLEASVNTVTHGVSAMRSGTPSRSAQAQLVVQSAGPDSAGALRFVVRPPIDDTDGSKSWARASRQAVTALEVFYQIEARKRDNVDHVLGLLDAFCPQLTSCLRTMIESHAVSLVATSSTVQLVMDALPGIRKSAWSANLRRKLNAA